MDVLEAIFTRRSIRRYSDERIDDVIVDKILHAAMYAPSAVNKQPWHFIVFEDKTTKDAIMKFHQNAGMLKEAQKCILVCYDEKLQHDEGYGIIDCSAATQNILLAAHAHYSFCSGITRISCRDKKHTGTFQTRQDSFGKMVDQLS